VIRVLHIDDEAPIRLLSRVNLEAEGMEVLEGADGRIGIELAKQERPDLILLNVNLPWRSGFEVAELLQEDRETREIPIVFLTGRSRPIDLARGYEAGAIDYMTKPFNPLELAPRIRELLKLERSELEERRRSQLSELRRALS
jgi:putative two-component system response regulator